jgi:glutaredoxin
MSDTGADAHSDTPPITVLWRPGCGFCRVLLSGLERHGITYATRNIWEDAQARAMLNERIGSETVPSVLLGDAILVNPSITDLLERLDS